ncbi:hypothetical protein GGQ95_000775 [Anoxybacillus rupiensis]|jgi:hypothetical protein|nr:hypothetical protein [Anoxybacillus rupiensis]
MEIRLCHLLFLFVVCDQRGMDFIEARGGLEQWEPFV